MNLKTIKMGKKAFTVFFTDQPGEASITQLIKFINEHNLEASDYHLIALPSGIAEGGFIKGANISCIYHSEKELSC